MQFLAYILVYPFLWFLSILPFRVLYFISDLVYILVYHIIRYRRKVVINNLNLVFPEKSEKEIKSIRKKFYKHLCDMFLEMVKTMSISEASLKKRFTIKNLEEFRRLEKKNKSVIVMYGHYASWEWSLVAQKYINFKGIAVYKRLANKYFDKLIKDIRTQYNTDLVSTKATISTINDYEAKGVKSFIAFLSDQSPKLKKEVHWGEFMGIETPCFTGGERLAKKLDLTVAYFKISKLRRGYYDAELITLTDTPKEFPDYELTDIFLKEVEKQIREAPEYYFWTHKRWKHRKEQTKF